MIYVANNKKEPGGGGGFALLLTLVVTSIVLAVGLSLMHITLKQFTLSSIARDSEIAFHAANTGLECLQYHRENNEAELIDTGDTSAPTYQCADTAYETASTDHDLNIGTGRLVFNYEYQYDVGNDACTEVSLYILDARTATADITHTANEGLDEITCVQGAICTTIFSRGFNRSCSNLNSIFTVQRELTIQY